jgi:hypothetical protein
MQWQCMFAISMCILELYGPSKESMQSNLFFVHGGRTCDEASRELVASSMVGFCGATTFYRMTFNTNVYVLVHQDLEFSYW